MRSREKNSADRAQARADYESSDISVRALAKKHGVNEKSVRNWIREGDWKRNSAPPPQASPQVDEWEQPPKSVGEAAAKVAAQIEYSLGRPGAPEPQGHVPEQIAPPRNATEIARDFCGTIDVLRAELDTVVRNLHLIRELAEADLDNGSEKASEARRKLLNKVLELPGLVKASNDLTSALARLTEAEPGKKDQQKQAAKNLGVGKFATPAAPTGQRDTLQ